MSEPAKQSLRIIARGPTQLAVVASCLAAIVSAISVGGAMLFIGPTLIILGVLSGKYARRFGNWLMWLGSSILSLMMLPLGLVLLPEYFRTARLDPLYEHGALLLLIPLWLASMALILWFDVTLIVDAVKTHEEEALGNAPRNLWIWLMLAVAIVISAYVIWASITLLRAHRLGSGRLDLFLINGAFISVVTLLDALLIKFTVKALGKRQAKQLRLYLE